MTEEITSAKTPNQDEPEHNRIRRSDKILSIAAAAASLLLGSQLGPGNRFQVAIEGARAQASKTAQSEASTAQPGPLLLLPAFMAGNPVALMQHDSHSSHSSHDSRSSHSSHTSHTSHSSGL